ITPTFSIAGSFKADIDDFLMNSPEDISIKASLQTDALNVQLPHEQSFQGQLNATITQGRWQKNLASLEGNITINQATISLNDQENIKGDLQLNTIKINKDSNLTTVNTGLTLNNFDVRFPGKILK